MKLSYANVTVVVEFDRGEARPVLNRAPPLRNGTSEVDIEDALDALAAGFDAVLDPVLNEQVGEDGDDRDDDSSEGGRS